MASLGLPLPEAKYLNTSLPTSQYRCSWFWQNKSWKIRNKNQYKLHCTWLCIWNEQNWIGRNRMTLIQCHLFCQLQPWLPPIWTCNELYMDLSLNTTGKLQLVHNVATWVVMDISWFTHVTHLLQELLSQLLGAIQGVSCHF